MRRRTVPSRTAAHNLGEHAHCGNQADSHGLDLEAVSTYIPGVTLLLTLTAYSAVSCALPGLIYTAYLTIGTFALNWWATPRHSQTWDILRYGIGIWVSWIAYGALFRHGDADDCNDYLADLVLPPNEEAAIRHDMQKLLPENGVAPPTTKHVSVNSAVTVVSNVCAIAAALVVTTDNRKNSPLVLCAAPLALTGLLVPNPEASFAMCTCVVRVVKAAVFALCYTFFYLVRAVQVQRTDESFAARQHFQAVTLASCWVLLCDHRCLWLAAPQVIYTLHRERAQQNAHSEVPSAIDLEQPPPPSATTNLHTEPPTPPPSTGLVFGATQHPKAVQPEQAKHKPKPKPIISDFERQLLEKAARGNDDAREVFSEVPLAADEQPSDTEQKDAYDSMDPLAKN